MATFDQIKEVRLTISDPAGFIDFIEVANQGALPSPHVDQTAYKAADTGTYWWYSGTAYETLDLFVSDGSLSVWIDEFGVSGAVRKAVERIIATLPGRLMIVKNQNGAESTEFIKLLELQKFYRTWLEDLTPPTTVVNTGRWGKSRCDPVAGGNV